MHNECGHKRLLRSFRERLAESLASDGESLKGHELAAIASAAQALDKVIGAVDASRAGDVEVDLFDLRRLKLEDELWLTAFFEKYAAVEEQQPRTCPCESGDASELRAKLEATLEPDAWPLRGYEVARLATASRGLHSWCERLSGAASCGGFDLSAAPLADVRTAHALMLKGCGHPEWRSSLPAWCHYCRALDCGRDGCR